MLSIDLPLADSLLAAYLLVGVTVGFGHCIGMCGPLVISFSISRRTSSIMPYVLYHGGRIVTYAVLGGAMAAAGSFTFMASRIAALQIGVMYGAGALIVLMGLAMGGWLPAMPWFGSDCGPAGVFAGWFRRMSGGSSSLLYFPMGLVLGLLPCGPVYTALLGVARGGMEAQGLLPAVVTGILQMSLFGIGTVPALVAVTGLWDLGWLKFRDRIYRVGALFMIGLGIYYIIAAARY